MQANVANDVRHSRFLIGKKLQKNYHVAVENVVHDLMPWQLGPIHQQLEHELQARVHFAAARFSFAFLAAPLRFRIDSHD